MRSPSLALALSFLLPASAAETYVVQPGDTLSQIIQRRYPERRIYGAKGQLREVLQLNRHIRDSDRIYPRQRIVFTDEGYVILPPQEEAPRSSMPATDPIPETPDIPEYQGITGAPSAPFSPAEPSPTPSALESNLTFAATYGAKYLSFSQRGPLGSHKSGALRPHHLSAEARYAWRKHTSVALSFESFPFHYDVRGSSSDTRQIQQWTLAGRHRWMLAGLVSQEVPIFQDEPTGTLETALTTVSSLLVGAEHPLTPSWQWRALARIPFHMSESSSDLKTSSLLGYGVESQLKWTRRLSRHWDLVWLNKVGHLQYRHDVRWDGLDGRVKMQLSELSSGLGCESAF